MKLEKNDLCWCKSGLVYGKCHFEFDQKLAYLRRRGFKVPNKKLIKTSKQIECIKKSAVINNGILDMVGENIKEGMTTNDIDKLVYTYTTSHGAIPAPLNFEGFPKSVCVSVNNEVCHGIPSNKTLLKNGDIVNVDVTTNLNGYYSDASRMFIIGEASEEANKLVRVTKECLQKGLDAVKPWGFLGDVGAAIYKHAKDNGFSVVREFCGHGVGLAMHEDPCVMHFGKAGTGMVLVPGMVITIEPMINAGKRYIYIDRNNGWTALTRDGSLSAQWEHTIAITENGYEIIAK